MTRRTPGNLEALARKTALYAGAVLALSTVLGLLNRELIAKPITQAIEAERVRREWADSVIVVRINNVANAQERIEERLAHPRR